MRKKADIDKGNKERGREIKGRREKWNRGKERGERELKIRK